MAISGYQVDVPKLAIGLVSGTSANGVSACIVRISGSARQTKLQVVVNDCYEYEPSVRALVFEMASKETGTADKICQGNFILGEVFAQAAEEIARRAGVSMSEIAYIASHGQVIYNVSSEQDEPLATRSNLAVAEPTVIAERTGVLTVADFHVRDLACGGVGAPMVAYADYVLFTADRESRTVQNIGGIANLTALSPGCQADEVFAFDTGPGVMVIDGVVRRLTGGRLEYDVDGRLAAMGHVHEAFLEELLEAPFIHRTPPKSSGREMFGDAFVSRVLQRGAELRLSLEDLTATVTALTARSIAYNYETFVFPRMKVDEVIMCGGGSLNPTLMRMLRGALPPCKWSSVNYYGVPEDSKEAVAFTILANETLQGKPGNLPSVTGARRSAPQGKIVLP